MQETPNLGLKKWEEGDSVKAWHDAMNDNIDAIDNSLNETAQNMSSANVYETIRVDISAVEGVIKYFPFTIPEKAGYTAVDAVISQGHASYIATLAWNTKWIVVYSTVTRESVVDVKVRYSKNI